MEAVNVNLSESDINEIDAVFAGISCKATNIRHSFKSLLENKVVINKATPDPAGIAFFFFTG